MIEGQREKERVRERERERSIGGADVIAGSDKAALRNELCNPRCGLVSS